MRGRPTGPARVTEEIVRAADPRYLDLPPLPYEEAEDQWEERAKRRRDRRKGDPWVTGS